MILIADVLMTNYNLYTDIKEAAEVLGMDRATLTRKLKNSSIFFKNNLMITTNVTIHKSKKGRK